jgi:hypothetical protein
MRFRINGLYRVREAFKSINTGDIVISGVRREKKAAYPVD